MLYYRYGNEKFVYNSWNDDRDLHVCIPHHVVFVNMKVGDLVKWESVPYEFAEVRVEYGIIIQLSRTGHQTKSAKILFTDGDTGWFDTQRLEVVNETGR